MGEDRVSNFFIGPDADDSTLIQKVELAAA